MAITSYPFQDQSTTESQYRTLFRETQGCPAGVLGTPGSTALRVTAPGSGMSLNVQAGSALVQGFKFDSSATEVVTIQPASSVARTDIVVLRLTPSVTGTSVGSITLAVLRGNTTTGAAPTPTQSDLGIYEFPLASVPVPANATSIPAGTIVDLRSFFTSASNVDTGWVVCPLASGMTGGVWVRRRGDSVNLRGSVVKGTAFANADTLFTLPSTTFSPVVDELRAPPGFSGASSDRAQTSLRIAPGGTTATLAVLGSAAAVTSIWVGAIGWVLG